MLFLPAGAAIPGDPPTPPADAVTPHRLFLNRRRLLRAGMLTATVAATAGAYRFLAPAADGSHVGGRLTEDRLTGFVPGLRVLPVLLCGSEPMMAATRDLLTAAGVPAANVAKEAFVPGPATGAGPEADAGGAVEFAAVTFERSGLAVMVTGDRTVLEAAERVGAVLPWECRSGICGQCKVRCTWGAVFMETRDALTDTEKADGFILACQSVPRSPDLMIDA